MESIKKAVEIDYAYIVIETGTVIFTFCINMLNNSMLNLAVWGVLTKMSITFENVTSRQ